VAAKITIVKSMKELTENGPTELVCTEADRRKDTKRRKGD